MPRLTGHEAMTTTPEQRATLPDLPTHNAINREPEKEMTERRILLALNASGDAIEEAIDARWYMARRSDGASPVYCSVWVHRCRYSGRGVARGYGYCKRSAAFGAALDSAGIKLKLDVSGRGMSAVDDALQAIADALGYGPVRRIVG